MSSFSIENSMISTGFKTEMGLFTNRSIESGEIVLTMNNVEKLDQKKKNELLCELDKEGIPHDIMIHFNSLAFVDSNLRQNWHIKKNVSEWYFMNHKRIANVELCLYKGIPAWKAIFHIEKGSELFYDYGEPDESWIDD